MDSTCVFFFSVTSASLALRTVHFDVFPIVGKCNFKKKKRK